MKPKTAPNSLTLVGLKTPSSNSKGVEKQLAPIGGTMELTGMENNLALRKEVMAATLASMTAIHKLRFLDFGVQTPGFSATNMGLFNTSMGLGDGSESLFSGRVSPPKFLQPSQKLGSRMM